MNIGFKGYNIEIYLGADPKRTVAQEDEMFNELPTSSDIIEAISELFTSEYQIKVADISGQFDEAVGRGKL